MPHWPRKNYIYFNCPQLNSSGRNLLILLSMLSLFELMAFSAEASHLPQTIPSEVSGESATQNQPWRLYRKNTEFAMHYREIDFVGKQVLEIQAKFVVHGRMSAFFRLLRDTEQASSWLDSARSVRIIDSPSPYEDWVHTIFNTPWPLQQRDMVTCSKWIQHADYSVEVNVFTCSEKLPVPPGTVRMIDVRAHWLLKPLSNQQYQIFYTGTADVGGKVPRWLTDKVALTSSYRSFRAMQQQLAKPEYQQALAEICELEHGQPSITLDRTAPVADAAACLALKPAPAQ